MKINRLLSALTYDGIKGHFGQFAEDVLVRKIFGKKYKPGVYVDVGSYHPFKYSNTAYFWMRGWHGVNIDANPNSIKIFEKIRSDDVNVWAAVIPNEECKKGVASKILHIPTVFDKKNKIAGMGSLLKVNNASSTIEVPTKSINQIVIDSGIKYIDFLNIDIEGYDELVIKDFNYDLFLPKVIAVEDFSDNFSALLNSNITEHLSSHGYTIVARAGFTSIFKINGFNE